MNIKDLKVVFAGCARDCEPHIHQTIKNLNLYSSLFSETYKIIIENGSKDKTKEILKQNEDKNNFFLFKEEFTSLRYRGERLERARNLIIETIRKNSTLKNCDLFVMVDLDDTGTFRISDNDIINSIKFLYSEESIAAVFANQLGTYYDMWTLRDSKYCKKDFWVEILQNLMKNKNFSEDISKNNILNVKKEIDQHKTFSFEKNHPPIPVDSAFGGFGIYKMKHVLNNKKRYKGEQIIDLISKDKKQVRVKYQQCEHVNFNLGLVEQNLKLFILPNLINRNFLKLNFDPLISLKLIKKD